MNRNQLIGKVILAGAGPGDPDLITVKALNYLKKADVIIVDRLVCDQLLEDHANKDALILHTGKQRQKENSTPQFIINELLVEYALQGKLVVRLKGGDVSLFSNLLDELKALSKHQISYEIIPGITAAAGAAAYAGIPLTAREHAHSVRFLTFYKKDLLEEGYWQELALTQDTLVFYMSSDLTDSLVQRLVENEIPADRFISVIEQATTPVQNVYTCNIHDYAKKWTGKNYISPTLIIIGKVAGLQEEFAWLPNSNSRENFFKPIEKKSKEEVRA
ncbi:MAG: uroporphyrinogen-III C-methyltransferase [Bacteroidetes bacterium]|nr:MAG: uroporphyrinogen-III C-methyltransferase [Bacteroidota bacterium]